MCGGAITRRKRTEVHTAKGVSHPQRFYYFRSVREAARPPRPRARVTRSPSPGPEKNGNRAWPVTLFPITLARSMRASLSIFLRALRGRKRRVFMGAAAPERGRTIVSTRAQGLIQATRRVMRSLLAPSAGSRSPSEFWDGGQTNKRSAAHILIDTPPLLILLARIGAPLTRSSSKKYV